MIQIKSDWWYKIAIPNEKSKTTFAGTQVQDCIWYKLPKDVYNHKKYPKCLKCQEKYVPINKGDLICFKCNFTQ